MTDIMSFMKSCAGENTIDYVLKRSKRAKNITIRIDKNGICNLIIPKVRGLSDDIIIQKAQKFLSSRKSWILDKIESVHNKKQKSLSDLGISKSLSDFSKVELRDLKKRTLDKVQKSINHFNKIYKFTYKKINIRNMSSRWGSCSASGNLCFNIKIGLLTDRELDYVVVHELCHLKEFNHSQRFWSLVELAIPDYKEIKKIMKGRVL